MKQTVVIGIAISILVLVFGFITPSYLSPLSLLTMLRVMAYPGIIAIGMAMCLMGGTIDLSVGAVAGLSAVLAARLMTEGSPVWFSVTSGVVMGAAIGYINALLIVRLGLTTFIATIGTMFAVRGIVYWISKGFYVYPLPGIIFDIGVARPLGISWAFIAFVALLVVFHWLLNHTVWGLTVRATGSDREVAFCNEVDVDRVQTQLHVIAGVLAAVAGLFLMCKIGGGQPTIGVGVELTIIAGCVIGGVSLFGYDGSMLAVFLGLLFLRVVLAGIVTSGVNPYLQPTVRGVIMLAAMLFDARQHNIGTFFRREI